MEENQPDFNARLPGILAKLQARRELNSSLSFAPIPGPDGRAIVLAIIEDSSLPDGFAAAAMSAAEVSAFGFYLLKTAREMGPESNFKKGVDYGTS